VGVQTFATDADEGCDPLREAFIAAVYMAIGEMAGVQVFARSVCPNEFDEPTGVISAVLALKSAAVSALILRFPAPTAAALASRILVGATSEVSADLVQDCVGEIANVVAGQAKALLAGTPYHFVFTVPEVKTYGIREPQPGGGQETLGISFETELGGFIVRLCLI
jgi:chemotaxis protein CheX